MIAQSKKSSSRTRPFVPAVLAFSMGLVFVNACGVNLYGQNNRHRPVPNPDNRRFAVEIQIVDSNDRPVPRALIAVNDFERSAGTPTQQYELTDVKGRARFQLQQGPYRIGIRRGDFGTFSQALKVRRGAAGYRIRIPVGEPVKPIVTRQPVQILVVDRFGYPAVGASVLIRRSADRKQIVSLNSGANGLLSLALPAGRFDVIVADRGPSAFRRFQITDRPVRLKLQLGDLYETKQPRPNVSPGFLSVQLVGGIPSSTNRFPNSKISVILLQKGSERKQSFVTERQGNVSESLAAGVYDMLVVKQQDGRQIFQTGRVVQISPGKTTRVIFDSNTGEWLGG